MIFETGILIFIKETVIKDITIMNEMWNGSQEGF